MMRARKRELWSLDNFDDGYVDNKGRFRVWLPDHPRAYKGGYILRSIVAFEAYHGIEVPASMDVHHIDGDRLNDSKENLALLSHGVHTRLTTKQKRPAIYETRICQSCGKHFEILKWRLKDPSRGKYCSQKCYHAKKRSEKHRENISKGLKNAYREGRRK